MKNNNWKELEKILIGIDRDCTDNAWWETSTGALFGKKKLAEIKIFIEKEKNLAKKEILEKVYEPERPIETHFYVKHQLKILNNLKKND